jgi:hypothetical protein
MMDGMPQRNIDGQDRQDIPAEYGDGVRHRERWMEAISRGVIVWRPVIVWRLCLGNIDRHDGWDATKEHR